MSISSDNQFGLLAKVETKQVQCLLTVLLQSDIHHKNFIAIAYGERAHNFAETLQFLQAINWVIERQGDITLSDSGIAACKVVQDDKKLRHQLTQILISKESPYCSELADYFLQFDINNGAGLVYRPSLSNRLQQSALRNFLMDLGAVSYRAADDTYVLQENAADLYVWAINFRRSGTNGTLHADIERKAQLGFSAEIAVLEYEKQRLGEQWSYKVEHIAAGNPFACYDIKSVTIRNDDAVERYIEVKAVPADSYQFYWTRSEMKVSQLLGEKYFLYLLPVAIAGGFDHKQMLIINNPYKTVYQGSESWQIEENVIVCKKMQ